LTPAPADDISLTTMHLEAVRLADVNI